MKNNKHIFGILFGILLLANSLFAVDKTDKSDADSFYKNATEITDDNDLAFLEANKTYWMASFLYARVTGDMAIFTRDGSQQTAFKLSYNLKAEIGDRIIFTFKKSGTYPELIDGRPVVLSDLPIEFQSIMRKLAEQVLAGGEEYTYPELVEECTLLMTRARMRSKNPQYDYAVWLYGFMQRLFFLWEVKRR